MQEVISSSLIIGLLSISTFGGLILWQCAKKLAKIQNATISNSFIICLISSIVWYLMGSYAFKIGFKSAITINFISLFVTYLTISKFIWNCEWLQAVKANLIWIIILVIILSRLSFGNLNTKNNSKKNEVYEEFERQSEEANIAGVYSGSKNISGLELVAKLTISGSRWTAISQLGNDNPEFQNGIVKGSDLYDESGMIKIGYVSGNSASINGYPNMTK